MLRAINNWCDHQDLNNTKHYFPPTNEPDLCKDYISMEEDENDQYKNKIEWSLDEYVGHDFRKQSTYDNSEFGKALISKLINFFKKQNKASENDKNEIYYLLDRFIALKYANAIQQEVQKREKDLKLKLNSNDDIIWFTQRNKYVMRIIERFYCKEIYE